MMKTLNRWLVTAGLVLGAAPVLAAGAHDHGHEHAQSHVHGAVQLEVALDGPTLSIALEAPLDSILGFERAPRTASEKQAAQDALTALRGNALFAPDAAAGCTPASASIWCRPWPLCCRSILFLDTLACSTPAAGWCWSTAR